MYFSSHILVTKIFWNPHTNCDEILYRIHTGYPSRENTRLVFTSPKWQLNRTYQKKEILNKALTFVKEKLKIKENILHV